MPLSIVLVKPEFDIWEPGEHNGTFRGFNPALVTARRTLELFWQDDAFAGEVKRKGEKIREWLQGLAARHPQAKGEVRGRGMMQAVEFENQELAGKVSEKAFGHRLIIETAGPNDEVLKLLPPLTIEDEVLDQGLEIIERALTEAMAELGIA